MKVRTKLNAPRATRRRTRRHFFFYFRREERTTRRTRVKLLAEGNSDFALRGKQKVANDDPKRRLSLFGGRAIVILCVICEERSLLAKTIPGTSRDSKRSECLPPNDGSRHSDPISEGVVRMCRRPPTSVTANLARFQRARSRAHAYSDRAQTSARPFVCRDRASERWIHLSQRIGRAFFDPLPLVIQI